VRVRATGPSSRPATSGATTQASAPIGSAAAAQMPRIFAIEYCAVRCTPGVSRSCVERLLIRY
jgi:hypothetical protein